MHLKLQELHRSYIAQLSNGELAHYLELVEENDASLREADDLTLLFNKAQEPQAPEPEERKKPLVFGSEVVMTGRFKPDERGYVSSGFNVPPMMGEFERDNRSI